jgi:hypothetical protein
LRGASGAAFVQAATGETRAQFCRIVLKSLRF